METIPFDEVAALFSKPFVRWLKVHRPLFWAEILSMEHSTRDFGKSGNSQPGTKTGTMKKQAENINSIQELFDSQDIKRTTNPLQKRLYTLKEASVYLGLTVWGLRELAWKGSIPIVRWGKRIFIDSKDIDAFIERSKITYER